MKAEFLIRGQKRSYRCGYRSLNCDPASLVLANYFKKCKLVCSISTQHALRSHLCARTRRTAPELPAAVPGLLAAPRFRHHPYSCAPHPRTPRTPLAAVIACSSVQRARRPRLRTRPSPVFSPRHEPTRPRSHTSTRATVRTELSPHAPTHTPRTHATPTQQQRVVFVRVVYNAPGLRPERRFVYISRGSTAEGVECARGL